MLIHTIPHPQHHPPVVEKVNKMSYLQCCQALLWPFFIFCLDEYIDRLSKSVHTLSYRFCVLSRLCYVKWVK